MRLPLLRDDVAARIARARDPALGRRTACAGFRAGRMTSPDVSVVVVTFNALPWIERCLESVRGNEVIVVDHGSTDGTVALVLERFPEVRLIEQENRGMGGGNNAGMRVAQGRYVF